jgi:hypothetical protein
MTTRDLDTLITRLLPQVLADPELGDGRSFTPLHLNHLWALSCLQFGECYDLNILAERVAKNLPPHVRLQLGREVVA